jgi:hypothetical protein
MPLQQNERPCDVLLPEQVLWSCIEALPDLSSLQAATIWSLALGASHSYEARSMIFSVFKVLHPAFIIETGTFHGLTSAFMWRLGDVNEQRPKLMTFDIESSNLAPRLWRNMGAADDITFVEGDSGTMIAQRVESGQEFVLIDGDHTYVGAERDWEAVQPHLAERSVVFFDNMGHSGGCGRFFATLDPLWFHPEMAIAIQGISGEELHKIFAFYIQRLLPAWMREVASGHGNEVRAAMRSLIELLEGPPCDVTDYQEIATKCYDLSLMSASAEYPRLSELLGISSQYGIGTVRQARHQRIREALPGWLLPWTSRLYRLVRTSQPKST